MNTDRLRQDLAALAGEVTPVDLRDRALRASRRLGVRRVVTGASAALVLLAAVTGTAFAVRPQRGASSAPATTQTGTLSPTVAPTPDPTPTVGKSPGSGSVSDATPVETVPPTIYWYSRPFLESSPKRPAKLWRKPADGKWQVVETGTAAEWEQWSIPSPDGRQILWKDSTVTPRRIYVSALDGSDVRVVASFSEERGCSGAVWVDNHRLVFTSGGQPGTVVSVDDRGRDRRTLLTDGPSCITDYFPAAGRLFYLDGAKVTSVDAQGNHRTHRVEVPDGPWMFRLAGVSDDGSHAVVNITEPGADGENLCPTGRYLLVDLATGAGEELRGPDRDQGSDGIGRVYQVVFLSSGGFLAQMDDTPNVCESHAYELVWYDADGKLMDHWTPPDAGTPFRYGVLVG